MPTKERKPPQKTGHRMNKLLKYLALAATVAGLAVGSAYATAMMTINDGVNPIITISDNGVGDINPTLGLLDWNGTVGVWTINLDSGSTKPVLGSVTNPILDLSFKAIDGGGVPTKPLIITFQDSGFVYTGGLVDSIGGTTNGTVLDNLFANGQLVTSVGPFGAGAFSGSSTANVVLGPSVTSSSLGLQVVITETGVNQITTGDKQVTAAPDGGTTALLLGFGLLGLGLIRRSKKS